VSQALTVLVFVAQQAEPAGPIQPLAQVGDRTTLKDAQLASQLASPSKSVGHAPEKSTAAPSGDIPAALSSDGKSALVTPMAALASVMATYWQQQHQQLQQHQQQQQAPAAGAAASTPVADPAATAAAAAALGLGFPVFPSGFSMPFYPPSSVFLPPGTSQPFPGMFPLHAMGVPSMFPPAGFPFALPPASLPAAAAAGTSSASASASAPAVPQVRKPLTDSTARSSSPQSTASSASGKSPLLSAVSLAAESVPASAGLSPLLARDRLGKLSPKSTQGSDFKALTAPALSDNSSESSAGSAGSAETPRSAAAGSGSGKRTFACPMTECGEVLSTRLALKRHLKRHSQDRPYACPHPGCRKRFPESSTLKRHIRIHTGNKPFKCRFKNCSKAFADATNLSRHEMTHTGEKPYKVCLHAI
jgi:hypothetical protein